MNIKKISLSLGMATLSIAPLYLIASCSSTPFSIVIPKILEDKITQIKSEIATESLDTWILTRQNWTTEWLMINNPQVGYISGGNVTNETIKNIKVSVNADGNLNFFLEVDKNSLNRFLNDKTEINLVISIAA